MPLVDQLEKFRKRYASVKVTVYDEYLVYKTSTGSARRACTDANELISDMGLPLVAKVSSGYKLDAFIVQENR